MKPRITQSPTISPWWLVLALFAGPSVIAVTEFLSNRADAEFRRACQAEGGLAFIGSHGRACLWAGAVIRLDAPSGAILPPPRPGEPTDQEPQP